MYNIADFPSMRFIEAYAKTESFLASEVRSISLLLPPGKIAFVLKVNIGPPSAGTFTGCTMTIDGQSVPSNSTTIGAGEIASLNSDHEWQTGVTALGLSELNVIPFRQSVIITLAKSAVAGTAKVVIHILIAEDPDREFQNIATLQGSAS